MSPLINKYYFYASPYETGEDGPGPLPMGSPATSFTVFGHEELPEQPFEC